MNTKILMAVYGPIQSDARVQRAARCLYESGYQITVVSINSEEGFRFPCFDNINIHCNRKYLSLFYFWYKVLSLARKDDYRLLYLHDYYMPLIGKIYKILTKKKWVYDAHELIVNPEHKDSSRRMRFFAGLERISISSADLVVAANEERLEVMKKVYDLKNGISVQNISDFSINKSTECTKDNVIVYQGAVMSSRRIDFYVRSHKFLPDDFILLLVGGGDAIPEIMTIAKGLGIEKRVKVTGKVSQQELYEYGAQAKVGIVTYPMEGLNNYYCAPNKIFEYAALKVPMIGTPQPFLEHMFKKYHIGEIVEWDDTEGYLNAINKITSDYNSYLANMDAFLNDNNWGNESQKLSKAITDILL